MQRSFNIHTTLDREHSSPQAQIKQKKQKTIGQRAFFFSSTNWTTSFKRLARFQANLCNWHYQIFFTWGARIPVAPARRDRRDPLGEKKQWCDTVDRVLCHGLEECDADRLRGTACCERYVSDSFDCRVPRTHILQGAECRHILKSQWPATFAI